MANRPTDDRRAVEFAAERSTVSLTWNLADSRLAPLTTFVRAIEDHGLRFEESRNRPADPSSADRIDELGVIVRSTKNEAGTSWLLRLDPVDATAFAYVFLARGDANLVVAAPTRTAVSEGMTLIEGALVPTEEPPRKKVPVTFWSSSGSETTRHHQLTVSPRWREISENYSARTSELLQPLVSATDPGPGRLILWHGVPGTGKTSALRALMREWREWCAPHVVSDPDEFLASGKSYMLDVLSARDSGPERKRGWKLVVLEDAGELMAMDARDRTGQALSRLLNVTDGLLGQGMNALVLVTTNEPLSRLHPAVHRPGRCWAEIEFEPLSTKEANEWLARHDSSVRVHRPSPVAELYALLRGEDFVREDRRMVGFGSALSAGNETSP